jgi:RNase P/RNase MRP subunit POP5
MGVEPGLSCANGPQKPPPAESVNSRPWQKPSLRQAKGMLSFYHTGLTSGKMEGINRKIRGLLASAFGFATTSFLKLRLYALHEAKFTFVG